ncbi:hypothetical protein E2C01_038445 [Portunus trituberculatus]|uniref:DUF7044 domain-containing protein n=1 Tax=Portunus trituberculatus TaxID=210409 RepID=A0A5B7FGS8_PORTR|nr:hypothetical protein [Portunus trituberculatus]
MKWLGSKKWPQLTFHKSSQQLVQHQREAVCYFNLEYQGVYVTQSIISVGSEINYLQVVIREDSIPIWGQCHKRLGGGGTGGGNVILYDR